MELIQRYFNAFNAGDHRGMLACVAPDVRHHVNQGGVREGRAAFEAFCAHMSRSYAETISDLVVFQAGDSGRAAAEYTVSGTYLQSDEGLPAARGQTYVLPAGSFFETRDGLITRITTYYNLSDWKAQVSQ